MVLAIEAQAVSMLLQARSRCSGHTACTRPAAVKPLGSARATAAGRVSSGRAPAVRCLESPLHQLGMRILKPCEQLWLKRFDQRQQFGQISIRDGVVALVCGQVALATERIHLYDQVFVYTQSQGKRLQRNRMMARLVQVGAISGCAQRNGGNPQEGIVRSGKPPFVTETLYVCVCQAAFESV